MKARELDKLFDRGEADITDHLDLSQAFFPMHDLKRVSLDLPTWMIDRLDWEPSKLGIPRKSLIKAWIVDRSGNLKSINRRTKKKQTVGRSSV